MSKSIQRILGDIVGMDDRAVEAISLSAVLSHYPAWNKEKNPTALTLMKDVFVAEGVPTSNINKGALFAEFMTYYCKPSMANNMSTFDEDTWFVFLGEHKLRKRNAPTGVGTTAVLLILLVIAAAATVPTFLVHKRTMRNTQVILDAMCASSPDLVLEVNCNDAACACCVDADGEACEME